MKNPPTNPEAPSLFDPLGLWKIRMVGGNWTGNDSPVINAFDSLKRNMPAYIARLREWMRAASKLPDKCAFKKHFQQELTKLFGILGVMEMGLNSDVELRIYSKRLDVDTNAEARFGWIFDEFTGNIYLNNHRENAHTNWETDKLNMSLFHELSHVAGVKYDDDKTEYWTDNAHNVDRIANNPANFSLDLLVNHAVLLRGNKCCPPRDKWEPNH